MEFENKVALVTGAAGSIGMAVAARLIAEGARTFVTDLDPQHVGAVVRRLGPACRAQPPT